MADNIPNISQEDINANKGMSVLSYIGILFLIPMLAKKDSAYCRFHANQGLVLFIIEIVCSLVFGILGAFLPILTTIGSIFSLVLFIFAIIGIVNAATGKVKGLPLKGGITLLK